MSRTTSGTLRHLPLSTAQNQRQKNDLSDSPSSHGSSERVKIMSDPYTKDKYASDSDEEKFSQQKAPVKSTSTHKSNTAISSIASKPKATVRNDDFDDEDDGPETRSFNSATSEDIDNAEMSIGGAESEHSFFNDDSHVGSNAASNDFSVSENSVSGSHRLDGYDYRTNAMPPGTRRTW